MHVEAWLTRAARRHPDRPAVNDLTYTALDRAATAAARALYVLGARAGDRVGLALPPGEDFVVAFHGCARLGVAVVPIDLRLGERERAVHTRTCKLVVDVPLVLDHGTGDDAPLLDQHDVDATLAVIHTSGTSGEPTAVALTYGNFLWSALGSAVALGVDPEERWLCALPLSHVGGLSIVVRSAIYGTTALVHEKFDTHRVLQALLDERVTAVSLVPTTLARLLDAGLRNPPTLRFALIGGASIPPALIARAVEAGVPCVTTYGLTEACSQVTTGGPAATAGAPLFCTRVEIFGDDEIVVSGPTVAGGGPLHTGDLGALDADGYLTVTGRKADTIVTGGENVAPTEVEAVLAEHPAVAEAAVHSRPHAEWGEQVVATVVLREPVDPSELRTHCAERLAPYKVPKAFETTETLPRTRSGKLLRRALS